MHACMNSHACTHAHPTHKCATFFSLYYGGLKLYYPFISCSCSWVKVDGDEYKLKIGVIVEAIDDMLTTGVVQKIFVIDEQIFIIVHLKAYKCTYDAHYHAYILGDETSCQIVSRTSLFYSGAVHIHTLNCTIIMYF